MKKKCIITSLLIILLFLTLRIGATTPELQKVFDSVTSKSWGSSKKQLDKLDKSIAEVNLLWGLWYGGEGNFDKDKAKSTVYLSKASEQGSRSAQLMLIGRFLFSKDADYVNYSAGVQLGNQYFKYLEEEIKNGRNKNGEHYRVLGKFYMFGIGTPKNVLKGISFLKIAASLGDDEALELVEEARENNGEAKIIGSK